MRPSNANNVIHALDYLRMVVGKRLQVYFYGDTDDDGASELPDLSMYDDESPFSHFIKLRQPDFDEYIVILLALAPHIRPELIENTIKASLPDSGDFSQLGGVRDKENRVLLPTAETALFLLAGDDLDRRFEVQQILSGDHWLAKEGILRMEPAHDGQPFWSGRLILNPEYIELFTLGRVSSPSFSAKFPAHEIRTDRTWDELVLGSDVLAQIEEIRNWVDHQETLMQEWGMRKILAPGYRVLFHGPPGTGKTLTATLLGKYTQRRVYRIDLSTVVSKYIGETEKNLASLFDRAENKNWLLFFDEADALFGKRTNVKDAHDRYANQEVSYLLQRVEQFDGLVILASNFRANLDDAFLRRFNSIVRFPFPDQQQRIEIWRQAFPETVVFDGEDVPSALGAFELAGGSIVNVVQHVCLEAIRRGVTTIRLEDAIRGVRREFEKEGKVFKNIVPMPSDALRSGASMTGSTK